MTWTPSKSIEESNARWAELKSDPGAADLYEQLPMMADPVFPVESVQPMSKSNQVMRSVLEEAAGIACGDRQDAYGLPETNHSRTAEAWNWYIKHSGRELDARDICWLNVLQKISRDIHCRRRDNSVDVCGFTANGEACRVAEQPVNGT